MKEIYSVDLTSKFEFDRCNFHYTNIWYDKENHRGIWKMTPNKEGIEMYEFINGIKRVNPDGVVVYTYPSDEDFGRYGWYIVGTPKHCEAKMNEFKNYEGKWERKSSK